MINAAINQANNIQRLVDAGATHFIVPNLPPLGLVPRLNGSPATSIPATRRALSLMSVLATAIGVLRDFNREGTSISSSLTSLLSLIDRCFARQLRAGRH